MAEGTGVGTPPPPPTSAPLHKPWLQPSDHGDVYTTGSAVSTNPSSSTPQPSDGKKTFSCTSHSATSPAADPTANYPGALQRDVAHFFGSITKAHGAGKRALFAAGEASRIAEAAVFCHEELGIGQLAGTHHLTLHQSVLGQCLPLVRIYVGCALQLFGDANSVDLVKIHLESRKVTFLQYDNFHRTEPNLVERIKVDLARLRVDYFDYLAIRERQPLLGTPDNYYQRLLAKPPAACPKDPHSFTTMSCLCTLSSMRYRDQVMIRAPLPPSCVILLCRLRRCLASVATSAKPTSRASTHRENGS